MLRMLVSMMALGAFIGCAGKRFQPVSSPHDLQERSISIEAVRMSPMPAAELLYLPKSDHGPILIALYTNRLALIDPINGRKIQEHPLTKRFSPNMKLVYIRDQPHLLNPGSGFSDLYLMNLRGEILWTYERDKPGNQLERPVSVMATMTFGDLDANGKVEFYVSSMKPPHDYVHMIDENGQFVRMFSQAEGAVSCAYYPFTCHAQTFVGATYDHEKGQPLLDFRTASGTFKQRLAIESRLVELSPLNWPTKGNYLLFDRNGMLYVLQPEPEVTSAKIDVGRALHMKHVIVRAVDSNEEHLVVLTTAGRRSGYGAQLRVLNKKFLVVGTKNNDSTFGICAVAPGATEFFVGGETGIYRCELRGHPQMDRPSPTKN